MCHSVKSHSAAAHFLFPGNVCIIFLLTFLHEFDRMKEIVQERRQSDGLDGADTSLPALDTAGSD